MWAAAMIGFSVLIGLAIYPGFVTTFDFLYAMCVSAGMPEGFVAGLLALTPYAFLLGLFLMPLISFLRRGWTRDKDDRDDDYG